MKTTSLNVGFCYDAQGVDSLLVDWVAMGLGFWCWLINAGFAFSEHCFGF
jgi:hypothetical protein